MSSSQLHRHCFEAMGTEIEVLLFGGPAASAGEAFGLAESLADEWTLTFSRFRADSELSLLNANREMSTSARLFEAIDAAVEAAHISDGAFNPLVLPALTAAGYDRSFDSLPTRMPATVKRSAVPDAGRMILDRSDRRVRLPAAAGLDLGGIAKGLYVDELAQRLGEWPGGIVSAGGDMRTWGEGPDDGIWAIGIESADRSEHDVGVVLLRDGGVATSGINRRVWQRNGMRMHHLIDPWTGSPAEGSTVAVTVIAPTATAAEIASTSLFIDPALRSVPSLTGTIWGAISIDGQLQHTCTCFNREAPFNVYLKDQESIGQTRGHLG